MPAKQYLSFEVTRDYARGLGIKTHRQWLDHIRQNQLPPRIPRQPHYAYRSTGFTTWAEFLGRSVEFVNFEDAWAIVRTWGIRDRVRWRERCQQPDFPEDIPRAPWNVYEKSGWTSLDDWLGNSNRWNSRSIRAFLEALRPVVRDLTPTELVAILQRKRLFRESFQSNSNRKILRELEDLCRSDDPETLIDELVVELGEDAQGGTSAGQELPVEVPGSDPTGTSPVVVPGSDPAGTPPVVESEGQSNTGDVTNPIGMHDPAR